MRKPTAVLALRAFLLGRELLSAYPCALVLTASNQKIIKDYLTEQKAVFPIEKLHSKQLNLKLERFFRISFFKCTRVLSHIK